MAETQPLSPRAPLLQALPMLSWGAQQWAEVARGSWVSPSMGHSSARIREGHEG